MIALLRGVLFGLIALATGAASTALAQTGGPLTTTVEVEKIVAVATDQPPVKSYAIPDTVVPGDRLRFTLTFTNSAAAPATGVTIVNPVPADIVYDDTADPDGFSLSIDGGESFGAIEAMTVAVAGAPPRAATAADVTHVRWVWPDAVAPGESRSVVFFGRVR